MKEMATRQEAVMRRGSRSPARRSLSMNVGETERIASAVGGAGLAIYGLTRGSLPGVLLALVGGSLVYRDVTGHCNVYEALGVDTAKAKQRSGQVSVPGNRGIKVEHSVTVNRAPDELYQFWRKFENLQRFMQHLESVTQTSEKRSHCVARAPLGTTIEWDYEIINEKPDDLIAWRSLERSDVDNAGSVRFSKATGGRGTEVTVSLEYDPPGGAVGAAIAKLFGEEPKQQVTEDLRRFKQLMEAGELPTIDGQPAGR